MSSEVIIAPINDVPLTRLIHAGKKNTCRLLNASQFYQRVNLALVIPSVLISSFLGAIVVSNEITKNDVVRIVCGVFAFVNAFLVALTRTMRPAEQAQQCDFFAHKWASFVRNMQAQVVMADDDETKKMDIFISSLKAYNEIMDISIYISNQLQIEFMDDMIYLQN